MENSNFEAIKMAVKQDSTGYVLNLRIHPNDFPEELLRDFVGSRYMVVMVKLDNENKPEIRVRNYIKEAGIICRDPDFWDFLFDRMDIFGKNEENAISFIYEHCKIKSRKELASSQEATTLFNLIKKEFQEWKAKKIEK